MSAAGRRPTRREAAGRALDRARRRVGDGDYYEGEGGALPTLSPNPTANPNLNPDPDPDPDPLSLTLSLILTLTL